MIMLFLLIIIVFLCLTVLAVLLLGKPEAKVTAPDPAEQAPQRKPSAAVVQDEMRYLTDELEKLKLQNQNLVSELEFQKNREFDLKENLEERKRREESQRGEIEILQQENMRLRQEILDKEAQQSMRIPAEVEDQLKAKAFRVQALEQENAETAEKIRKLEAAMAEVRATQKRSESVYKQEYESLLKQFQLKEEALRRLQGELSRSQEEYDALNHRLLEKEDALEKAMGESGFSEEQKSQLSLQLSQREDQLQELKEELKRIQGEMLKFQALQNSSPAEAAQLLDDAAAGGQKDDEEKRNGLKKMLDSLEKKP